MQSSETPVKPVRVANVADSPCVGEDVESLYHSSYVTGGHV